MPYWYEWRDLNPQSIKRQILSLMCIPFHHTRNNSIIHQTILQVNNYLEWVTGLEPALLRFAICYLTIQCTPTYLWHGMQESNPHS